MGGNVLHPVAALLIIALFGAHIDGITFPGASWTFKPPEALGLGMRFFIRSFLYHEEGVPPPLPPRGQKSRILAPGGLGTLKISFLDPKNVGFAPGDILGGVLV